MALHIQETLNQLCLEFGGICKFILGIATKYPQIVPRREFASLAQLLVDVYIKDISALSKFGKVNVSAKYYKQQLTIGAILSEPKAQLPFYVFKNFCRTNGVPEHEFASAFPPLDKKPTNNTIYYDELCNVCISEYNILMFIKRFSGAPAWIDTVLAYNVRVLKEVFSIAPSSITQPPRIKKSDVTAVISEWYTAIVDGTAPKCMKFLHRSPQCNDFSIIITPPQQ